MDEDAAILARIEREEQEEEEQLIRRAEELGLYKPQSGKFGSSTTKEGDVYGSSVLDEVRKKNIKESKQTEEKQRQDWLDGEAKRIEQLQAQAEKLKGIQKYEPQELTEGEYHTFTFRGYVAMLTAIQHAHEQIPNNDLHWLGSNSSMSKQLLQLMPQNLQLLVSSIISYASQANFILGRPSLTVPCSRCSNPWALLRLL